MGEVEYVITWIFNKGHFLQQLKDTMLNEKKALIDEIKNNDEKLRLISDPFGGFRNVLDVNDLYFKDPNLP